MVRLVTRDEAIDAALHYARQDDRDVTSLGIACMLDEVHQHNVYDDVVQEREYQDAKWGGPEHDDTHTSKEFLDFIDRKIRRANHEWFIQQDKEVRKKLIQIAALAVAAVESIDRQRVKKRQSVGGDDG